MTVYSQPTPAEFRELLIIIALDFALSAITIQGVTRLSLAASLATEQEDPPEVEFLVNVAPGVDMESLAAASRRMVGAALSLPNKHEGHVYLLDSKNKYLGFVCPWKVCRRGQHHCPSVRCGTYIYAVPDKIVLKPTAIATSIQIWPEVTASVPIPEDIKQGLIGPLLDS